MTGASSSGGENIVAEFDALRRRADIRRGLDVYVDRDDTIVEGLYQHFMDVHGRQPEGDEFPAYVYLITSTHEWLELWELFSPHSPLTEAQKKARLRRVAPWSTAGHGSHPPAMPVPQPRRPGRPGWTAERFWDRYRDAYGRSEPPHTYRSIAQHFVALDGTMGTSPEYLRKLVHRFPRPPR